MTTAASKVKTKSLRVPQLKSICLHSGLTWISNDPTSCSLWPNIIGYENKTKQHKTSKQNKTNDWLVVYQISSGFI